MFCSNVLRSFFVLLLIMAYSGGAPLPAADLVTPEMMDGPPAPGRRVKQVAPEYTGTEVYHTLYLPVDWKAGRRYPVIVEYTGNKFLAANSSGEVKDAHFGYGLSGGSGYLWVVMPYVEVGQQKNALTWWGDKEATVAYCKTNLPRICEEFGGDPERVVLCGFSRGAIATSYIGLADEEIAGLWAAFITHDHFDGQREWGYPDGDRASALKRLARMRGRPLLVCDQDAHRLKTHFLHQYPDLATCTFLHVPTEKIYQIPEGPVLHPHTDLWMHRESAYREQVRGWLYRAFEETR